LEVRREKGNNTVKHSITTVDKIDEQDKNYLKRVEK